MPQATRINRLWWAATGLADNPYRADCPGMAIAALVCIGRRGGPRHWTRDLIDEAVGPWDWDALDAEDQRLDDEEEARRVP